MKLTYLLPLLLSCVLSVGLFTGCATTQSNPTTFAAKVQKVLADNAPRVRAETVLACRGAFLGAKMAKALTPADEKEIGQMLYRCGEKAVQFTGSKPLSSPEELKQFFVDMGVAGVNKYSGIVDAIFGLVGRSLAEIEDPALAIQYIRSIGQGCMDFGQSYL